MKVLISAEEGLTVMSYEIMEYARLTLSQKSQAVDLFMEGFGHMMTFSKNEKLKKELMLEIFHPTLFRCYVENGKVLGLLGIATHEMRPIDFRQDTCVRLFGKIKGAIISKQMNAFFQKPVVSFRDELYIDVLVTGAEARRKGIASMLLNDAFQRKRYSVCYLHVFSNNQPAISLYEKHGFTVDRKEKMSLMRFVNAGYPVRMKKILV